MLRNGRGYSLIELLAVIAFMSVIGAMALPRLMEAAEAGRIRGAAYYVSSRFNLARMMAAQRNANVAFRFEPEEDAIRVRTFMDTNNNGVRSAEILSGVDVAVLPIERLDRLFGGVRFGFVPGARLIDGTSVSPADDPIRFGAADMLTFSPSGTATSGTVYLRGRGDRWQFAIVVLGATGRTRIARFDTRTRQWSQP
jgi:Tfp pilus assembly protein FimT